MKAKKSSRSKTTVGLIDREVLAFTAGRDVMLDAELIEADCLATAAHVTMLSRLRMKPKLFTVEERRRIVRELAGIVRAAGKGEFRITIEDQDVHLAVERALTEVLGDLGKRVHSGRSRNDLVATDLRLYAKDQLLDTMTEAAVLAGAFVAFAGDHADVPMVGRTHMQPAMPSSVGLWASAQAESLLEDIVLLMTAFELNDQCPLGSAASYGVPLPIDRQLVSDLLGFGQPVHNVLHANNARGKLESILLSALAQVMLTLSRFAQDLIIWSMPEFGYFELPAEFCTGSSIMPQKKNPDVLELVRARAAAVQAAAHCTADLVRAAPSGYNRDLQEAKGLLMDGFRTVRGSLRVLVRLVPAIRVSREALLAGFTPGVFATDRVVELVGEGMPFRDAYHEVKKNLAELESRDAQEAVAAKTHLGAPGGLDLDGLADRIREAADFAEEERAEFNKVKARLLGGKSKR